MNHIYLFLLFLMVSCLGKSSTETKNINPEKTVACFIYHRFGDSRFPSTNVSINDFEKHLRYLSENNFQVLSLSEALDYLESDEPVRKTVVLTIDDGYKSFYENALPLLRKYKMPATMFINTETVGGKDYMNWTQLKEIMKANVEIGNHTHTHAYFLNEDETTRYTTFENEINESQKIITENLGVKPILFAYPYGEFDEQMKNVVRKLNFQCGAAQYSGVLYYETDRYQLPRFPMAEAYANLDKFVEKVSMKPLRVTNESIKNTVLQPTNLQPKLTLTFDNIGLELNRLQCFVQGSECDLQIQSDSAQSTITLQAAKDLATRRRTLYTITVPDGKGNWYWYSHLWINPNVK